MLRNCSWTVKQNFSHFRAPTLCLDYSAQSSGCNIKNHSCITIFMCLRCGVYFFNQFSLSCSSIAGWRVGQRLIEIGLVQLVCTVTSGDLFFCLQTTEKQKQLLRLMFSLSSLHHHFSAGENPLQPGRFHYELDR